MEERDERLAAEAVPEVVDYRPDLHRGMLSLFARHFGQWSADGYAQRFSWEREQNPYAVARPWRTLLLVVGQRVVGHVSGTPLPIVVCGEAQTALAWGSFAADEAFRGRVLPLLRAVVRDTPIIASGMSPNVQGMFERLAGPKLPLTEVLWTLERSRTGTQTARVQARVPGPLRPFMPTSALRLAGRVLSRELSRPDPLVPRIPRGKHVRPIDRFDASYDPLWQACRQRFEAYVDRTRVYMNWRYFDCPTLTPRVYGLFGQGGQLEGVVVGVLRGIRDWSGGVLCGRNATVADLITAEPDPDHADALLGTLINELDPCGIDAIDAFGPDEATVTALRRLGFRASEDPTYALGVGLGRSERARVREHVWLATPGDGDALFAPAL